MREIRKIVGPSAGFQGEVGTWWTSLEDVRGSTKAAVAGLGPEELSWKPPLGGNSIGQLLRHIAGVEIEWIFSDLGRGEPFPADLPPVLQGDDPMSDPGPRPLAEFLSALDYARAKTRERLERLDPRELDSLREFKGPEVLKTFNVRWILYHLVDHEAQHKGQILAVRRMRTKAGSG